MLSQTRSDLSPVRHDMIQVLGEAAQRGFSDDQRHLIDSTVLEAASFRGSWFIRVAGVSALGARLETDHAI